MSLRKIQNEKGMALFIALILTLMISIMGIALIKTSNDEITIAGNELNELRTFYAAEAALDKAAAEIQTEYEATGVPPVNMPEGTLSLDTVGVIYTTNPEDTVQKVLTKGSLAGLHSLVKPFTIRATALDPDKQTTITLEETFEVALVPIFQFSVFYENDLEIAPGPNMLLFGRVHSNNDIYLQSGNTLNIDSYMTAYGDIFHGRKPGSGQSVSNGNVNIMGLDGSYHSMRDGAGWLESTDAHWFDTAAARWGGRVQDAAFGQSRLNLPLEGGSIDAHKIIEPASAGGGNDDSFENKADFKIMDGVAYSKNAGGTWTDVTATLIADGSLTSTTFHDKREGNDVTVYDIDMSVFTSSPYFPSNGIMYADDDRSGDRGTRLFNADDIGVPFTIASDNPIYTKGDVNTVNKQPMAIITDALTILSDNWSDNPARAASSDKYQRPATATDCNFSFITGNQNTGSGGYGYNGGLENLPRFLENWSSQTLTYRGSIICLWLAQKLTGAWNGSVYNPPNRDWAFDTDLTDPNKLPPGCPAVRTFIRMGWKQSDVSYTDEASYLEADEG
ncbi:MAG: PilX N-terminal domain-containing pilus assembly protein [Candidatus Zixiibacteriota bacterium]